MPNITVDIEAQTITSAYVGAPLDEGKKTLENFGFNIISPQENAFLRMRSGIDSDITKYGNWTSSEFIYVPKKGIFLSKKSNIMLNTKKATHCHGIGEEFYLTNKQVEKSLSDSLEIIPTKPISTKGFGKNKITIYTFRGHAQKYGEFLKEAGIDEIIIWPARLKDKPFARLMWFEGILNKGSSDFHGNFGLSHFCLDLRGIVYNHIN